MLCFGASTGLSSWRVVLGDLVDVAAWGIVPCVYKLDTLGLVHSLLKEKYN
jgi:tetrahydromethanopterin S-methyltransferase subunit E